MWQWPDPALTLFSPGLQDLALSRMRCVGTVHAGRAHGILDQGMGVYRHARPALLNTPGVIQNRLKIKLDQHVMTGQQKPQVLQKVLIPHKCHTITATPLVKKPQGHRLDIDA